MRFCHGPGGGPGGRVEQGHRGAAAQADAGGFAHRRASAIGGDDEIGSVEITEPDTLAMQDMLTRAARAMTDLDQAL